MIIRFTHQGTGAAEVCTLKQFFADVEPGLLTKTTRQMYREELRAGRMPHFNPTNQDKYILERVSRADVEALAITGIKLIKSGAAVVNQWKRGSLQFRVQELAFELQDETIPEAFRPELEG